MASVLVFAGGVPAFADDGVARAETGSAGFGMLGPVGLVAVALGIVGMTLGVLRQRRKARAAALAESARAHTGSDEPTRPLTALRQP
ncbi:hypothetical protein [Amycolatopsis ultiminotia]|uniref:hypothetical protein n=1 Tax=Amycolatopsis ultiminotia TaxID=543629 RepID=UPI003CD06F6E